VIDEVSRAMDNIIAYVPEYIDNAEGAKEILSIYDNQKVLSQVIHFIAERLDELSELPNKE